MKATGSESSRAAQLFAERFVTLRERVSRVFVPIVVCQYILLVATSVIVTPLTWIGTRPELHNHVYIAILIGGWLTSVQVWATRCHGRRPWTPHAFAVVQACQSAVWIHITGGRIETHFHAFVSLAALAAYRDPRVLVGPTLVIAADHVVRGVWFPLSVFGIGVPDPVRWVEHTVWVLLLDVWLIYACWGGLVDMRQMTAQRADLEAVNDEIERQVAARTEELREARDEALESSRLKSQFLNNMSHEVRTPMNGILGFAEILGSTDLDGRQRESLQSIVSAGEALFAVLNDILDFAKVEAGELQLADDAFDLRELAERVAYAVSLDANAKGLALWVDVDTQIDTLRLRGDPERVRQVLLRLLTNAVRFTDSGRILLRCVLESASSEIARVRIDVEDTGRGVEPERVDAIFEAFVQADGSRTRAHDGVGLGLSISRQLVEAMGGVLECRPAQGRGSVFSLSLGLTIDEDELDVDLPDLSGTLVSLLRLDADAARILEKYLVAQQAEVSIRSEVVEVAEEAPGLVVVDVDAMHEPGMNRLLELACAGQVMLVFLTHPVGSDELREHLGATGFISRPLNRRQLTEAVAAAGSSSPQGKRRGRRGASGETSHRILVVDDNAINRRMLEVGLRRSGFVVDTACDGSEAVAAAERSSYDLVLMDVQMPVMDGVEATRRIRDRAADGPQILALTAHGTEADRAVCLDAGMDDYLTKPVRLGDLVTVLRQRLGSDTR